eukprot:460283-Pelagomonas_calceolata.AAC.1
MNFELVRPQRYRYISSALLLADFGAAPNTAPHQCTAGGHLGTQSTSRGPPAGLGVQLEGQGTQGLSSAGWALKHAGLACSRVVSSKLAEAGWLENSRMLHRNVAPD